MIAAAEAQRSLQQECQWGGRLSRSISMLQRAEPNGRRLHHDLSAYGLNDCVMLAPRRAQQASQARLLL
eukprot:4221287-Pleurochrysis_carterae.AAC.1